MLLPPIRALVGSGLVLLTGCASKSEINHRTSADVRGAKAYLNVALRHQGTNVLCHATISGVDSPIRLSEIDLHVFDQDGKPIRLSRVWSCDRVLPVANTTANAIFSLAPAAGQSPCSATLAWGGTIRRVEHLVWLDESGK
jgi:hypothetical protein